MTDRTSGGFFRILALAVTVALSGCAGTQTHDLIAARQVPVTPGAIAGSHEIFIATTRQASTNRNQVFSGERSPEISYARVDITVPAIHETGRVERPKRGLGDPARYFTATSIAGYADDVAFSHGLRRQIAASGGRAMVFVHGYNTNFDDAVYRLTQIVQDSGYRGTPILFTWASGGRTIDYVYDNNSATAARDALEKTLRLVSQSGAKRIDIVAHSMGSWVTMEALRQLAITGHHGLDGKLGDVVLASPDIDLDVFKSQMRRYGVPKKPFYVLVSSNDRALNISGLIAGQRPRLGDYTDAADIASLGIIVADVSQIEVKDRLNHSKFAENPALVELLGKTLNSDDRDAAGESQITARVGGLARNIGQTVTSAAEIIITTPVEVLRLAVDR